MTAASKGLLIELEAAGVTIARDGDFVVLAPQSKVTRELHLRVAGAKRELLALLAAAVSPLPSRPSVRPVRPVVVHFETRCPLTVEEVGARAYAEHPEMEVLTGTFLLPDGSFLEWPPDGGLPAGIVRHIDAGAGLLTFSDHDVDRFIWERLGWPGEIWANGQALARMQGRPGNFDALVRDVLGAERDSRVPSATSALGRRDRHGQLPAVTPRHRVELAQAGRTRVLAGRKVWDGGLEEAIFVEPRIRELDSIINARGFSFDIKLAEAILRVEARMAREARHGVVAPPRVVGSSYGVKQFLASAGIDAPSAKRDDLQRLLDDPNLPDSVRRVISAHLASEGIVTHKLRAALRRVGRDGRLRDALLFHGAHTGRWSGHGFQPHNLPRGASFDDDADLQHAADLVLREDLASLKDLAASRGTSASEICAALVRGCVCAPLGKTLGVVDFAQIEPRVLAWMVDDGETVDRFANGVDPYREMAAKLFDIEVCAVSEEQRRLGKALVLGCGYQMGPDRFKAYAELFGVDWSALDITPREAVAKWRAAHELVAGEYGLWALMDEAAQRAINGEATSLAHVRWERRGEDVACVLPSRRPLIYRRPRLELRRTPWGDEHPAFTYELRGQRVDSYGGKLVENVTQAICRDLLAESLLGLEEAGKMPVLHVHDECICELDDPREIEDMKSIMCRAPIWTPALPLDVTGHVGTRYRK